ncbi:MAG: futalosine hydrolase [Bacteroidia bacterium]
MKILLVAATQFEIAPLLNYIGATSVSEGVLSAHTYKQHEIVILITGVGMVATAYYVGKNIGSKYDFAINAGICGSFNRNLDIGTVVDIVEDSFSELGAEDGDSFLSLSDLNLPGCITVKNPGSPFKNAVLDVLPKVNGITVNKVHGNESSIDMVTVKFHPIVESMEGAAFMFACKGSGIPYAQIRSVSNYVERRNKDTWNIPLAIENLNKKLMDALNAF